MQDPKKRWVLALMIVSLAGMVLAGILTYEHYVPMDLPGCSANGTFDCAKVNGSAFSEIRGISVAVLGFVTYLLVAGLCITRLRKGPEKAAGSMAYAFVLAVISAVLSAFLFYVSKFVLGSFCLYCIGLYVVNASMLIAAWGALGGPGRLGGAIRQDLDGLGKQKPIAYGLFGLIVLLAIIAVAKPGKFFNGPGEVGNGIKIPQLGLDEKARKEILEAPYMNPGPGGGFAKGAATPVLTIIEFADFECPACRSTSWELAELVKKHPEEVRVVFRHYPLDTTCNTSMTRQVHPFACSTALAVEAAGEQGKFWNFHDAVYAKKDNLFGADGRPDLSDKALEARAKSLGLDLAEWEAAKKSPAIQQKVVDDIIDGGGFGVQSTPTLFVNGRRISGGRPFATLEVWLKMAKAGELNPPEKGLKPSNL